MMNRGRLARLAPVVRVNVIGYSTRCPRCPRQLFRFARRSIPNNCSLEELRENEASAPKIPRNHVAREHEEDRAESRTQASRELQDHPDVLPVPAPRAPRVPHVGAGAGADRPGGAVGSPCACLRARGRPGHSVRAGRT